MSLFYVFFNFTRIHDKYRARAELVPLFIFIDDKKFIYTFNFFIASNCHTYTYCDASTTVSRLIMSDDISSRTEREVVSHVLAISSRQPIGIAENRFQYFDNFVRKSLHFFLLNY